MPKARGCSFYTLSCSKVILLFKYTNLLRKFPSSSRFSEMLPCRNRYFAYARMFTSASSSASCRTGRPMKNCPTTKRSRNGSFCLSYSRYFKYIFNSLFGFAKPISSRWKAVGSYFSPSSNPIQSTNSSYSVAFGLLIVFNR